MPVQDGRACERRAEYQYRDCKPPTGKWPEGCNVTYRETRHLTDLYDTTRRFVTQRDLVRLNLLT